MESPHDPHGAGVELSDLQYASETAQTNPAAETMAETRDAPRRRGASDLVCVAATRDILVVDDNDRHLDILSSILRSVGHDVETCGSGADALQRLEGRRYDAVVLDMVMPEINGVVVASQMRDGPLNKRTPVIACTANVMIARTQLNGIPGIAAIIGKPIEAASLVMAVAHLPFRERASPGIIHR
jgi:CheY-like chemotaxis protein